MYVNEVLVVYRAARILYFPFCASSLALVLRAWQAWLLKVKRDAFFVFRSLPFSEDGSQKYHVKVSLSLSARALNQAGSTSGARRRTHA